MAFLVRLHIQLKVHDQDLARQVAQRTSEIQTAQLQLRAIVDAIPDPLYEIDGEGRYCSVHSQRV